MGSAAGLSLLCVLVASGHAQGTKLVLLGFGMDQEPGDAAGEVSLSVTMAMAKPLLMASGMEQLPHGTLAPKLPRHVWGEPQRAKEPSHTPSR